MSPFLNSCLISIICFYWQRLMAIEDMTEEERRETNEKLEMLQSVVRTFELKTKNAQDHSKRGIFYILTFVFFIL